MKHLSKEWALSVVTKLEKTEGNIFMQQTNGSISL